MEYHMTMWDAARKSKNPGVYIALVCLSIVLGLLFMTPVSWAAPPPTPGDLEELNRRDRQQAQERQNKEEQSDVFLQSSTKANVETSLPEEAVAFPIQRIQVTGERQEHFQWIQNMLKTYTGRQIGKEGINIIIKRINQALIDRGYITTRIMVPEQDLSKGTLRFVLVPGVIRHIAFAQPPKRGSWSSAFPARPGDILNLRDLEQGLEQMKRVSSQDVEFKLIPGEKPGQSDIIIHITQRKPWKFLVSADDSGSKETGRIQSVQTFSLDNLFGANDILNISNNHDADFEKGLHGTHGYSFKYSVPQGYWTYTVSHSYYTYHQTVAGANSNYVYSGDSDTTEFRVERLIERNQTSKTTLQAKMITKNSRSYLEDTEIEVQRKDTTAAELAVSHRQYYGKAVWDIELAHRMGTPWLGAQAEASSGTSDSATTRYHLWTLDSSFTKPFKIGDAAARYTCNIRAQFTNDTLYATDCFSIGNRYTVRGFDGEQTLSAEKGYFIQNEISMSLAAGREIYAGIDYGKVDGTSAGELLGKQLIGSVIGLRGACKQVSYDIFVGWPIYKPAGYKTAPTTYGFQLTCQI